MHSFSCVDRVGALVYRSFCGVSSIIFFFPRYFDVKAAVSLLLPSTFLSSRDVLVLFGTLLCVVFRVLMFLEHEKLSALFFLALVPNSIFRE